MSASELQKHLQDFKNKTVADHFSDSVSFKELQKILDKLPSNIYLKDAEGRYVFCTHYWHHLDFDPDSDWDIRGKTDIEIRKDKENAIKAMESDRAVLTSGKGTHYTICFDQGEAPEYLEIIKEPLFDDDGAVIGIVGLINNVTESEMLKNRLRKMATTDPLTGLKNRACFLSELDEILAGPYPISVMSIDCDSLKHFNDTYGHSTGDEYLRRTALLIRNYLPATARIYRVGGDEFLVILNGVDEEDAQGIMTTFSAKCAGHDLKGIPFSFSYGVDGIASRQQSIYIAIDRADRKMYENKNKKKGIG